MSADEEKEKARLKLIKETRDQIYNDQIKSKPFGPVMDPNFANVFKVITLIAPFFIVLLLVTISIINSDIKGFVYLGGVVFLFVIAFMFQSSVAFNNADKVCAIWNIGPFKYPSFISALYTYTIVYLFYPMITNQVYNFPLLILLLVIYVSDIIIRCLKMACSNMVNVLFGSILGMVFAVIFILMLSNYPSLLYYNNLLSSKVACSVPAKQKFKCSIYNNGELVKSEVIDKNNNT
jgi:hypothetical protein